MALEDKKGLKLMSLNGGVHRDPKRHKAFNLAGSPVKVRGPEHCLV